MRHILSYWWLSLIVLIGWLVAPAFYEPMDHAPIQRAIMDVRHLETALELFRQDHGGYPSAAEGLDALVKAEILRRLPEDPWDSSYVYKVSSTGIGSIYSVGQNRADENGAGDDVTAERNGQICDEYDRHCGRHLRSYVLLSVASASLAVGIVRVVLWLRRAVLRIAARLRD